MADPQTDKPADVAPILETLEQKRLRWQLERDSYAPLRIELEYEITEVSIGKNGEILEENQNVYPLAPYHCFQSLTIDILTQGGCKGQLTLFDKDGSLLSSIFFRAGKNYIIRARFGWDEDAGGGAAFIPEFRFNITSVHPSFSKEGITYTIELVQASILRSHLDKARNWRVIGTAYTASGAFIRIARKAGWKKVIVERSVGKINESRIRPSGMTDIEFVQRTLLPMAVNRQGDHFDFYFDPRGVAHFHSPYFQVPNEWREGKSTDSAQNTLNMLPPAVSLPGSVTDGMSDDEREQQLAESLMFDSVAGKGQPLRTYYYAADPFGEVLSFEPKDDGVFTSLLGNAMATLTGTDSEGGKPADHRVGPTKPGDKTAGGLDGKPSGTLGSYEQMIWDSYLNKIDPGMQDSAVFALAGRDPAMVKMMAQAFYSRARAGVVGGELEVKGTHGFEISSLVNVVYQGPAETANYLSGTFSINKVTHTIDAGGWKTKFELNRAGNFSGLEGVVDAVKQDAGVIVGVDYPPDYVPDDGTRTA